MVIPVCLALERVADQFQHEQIFIRLTMNGSDVSIEEYLGINGDDLPVIWPLPGIDYPSEIEQINFLFEEEPRTEAMPSPDDCPASCPSGFVGPGKGKHSPKNEIKKFTTVMISHLLRKWQSQDSRRKQLLSIKKNYLHSNMGFIMCLIVAEKYGDLEQLLRVYEARTTNKKLKQKQNKQSAFELMQRKCAESIQVFEGKQPDFLRLSLINLYIKGNRSNEKQILHKLTQFYNKV